MVLYYEPIPEEDEKEGAKGASSTATGPTTPGKGPLSPSPQQAAKIVFRTLRTVHRVEVSSPMERQF